MNKSLAQYIMRGRVQAAMVVVIAVVSMLFYWVGCAAVALVTLRHGHREGLFVFAMAMVPAVVFATMAATPGPATTLIGSFSAALVLRSSNNWSLALLATVVMGLATSALLMNTGFGAAMLDAFYASLQDFANQFNSQLQAQKGMENAVFEPSRVDAAGILGVSATTATVICLVLARWWQAMLYNPGGFREEFHQLRLSPIMVMGLVLTSMLLVSQSTEFRFWSAIATMPILVAGIALVHALVAAMVQDRGTSGRGWLIGFYVGWLLFSPVKLGVLLIAITDSFLDIRGRINSRE